MFIAEHIHFGAIALPSQPKAEPRKRWLACAIELVYNTRRFGNRRLRQDNQISLQ